MFLGTILSNFTCKHYGRKFSLQCCSAFTILGVLLSVSGPCRVLHSMRRALRQPGAPGPVSELRHACLLSSPAAATPPEPLRRAAALSQLAWNGGTLLVCSPMRTQTFAVNRAMLLAGRCILGIGSGFEEHVRHQRIRSACLFGPLASVPGTAAVLC